MACMEDLLLQKGCLKSYATFCLGEFLNDLIYELILFVFMFSLEASVKQSFIPLTLRHVCH